MTNFLRKLLSRQPRPQPQPTDEDTDLISPISEGIPLLEAERIARHREPGDGSPQKVVVEQINVALTIAHEG